MLYARFSAGTAGDDGRDVGLEVAQRRVTQGSAPFLELGAGGYLTNWFGDAFETYLVSLFEGATLREAYEGFYDFDANTVFRGYHPDYPRQVL